MDLLVAPLQAIQIIIGALILCLSASVLQIHEVHFTEDVFLFLIVVIQVTIPSYCQQELFPFTNNISLSLIKHKTRLLLLKVTVNSPMMAWGFVMSRCHQSAT